MTTYKKGSRGDGVKDLQERLNNAGDYNLEPDGIYGDKTEAAVRDYQTKNNLKVDGIAGEETQGSLTGRSSGSVGKTDNSQSTPVSSVNTQPNLRQTAQSQLSALQKGYFNPLDETIDTLYDKIINQKQFEYDPFGDVAYNQYAEAYKRNAALMSEDAMAQAAALTGGYGSSYGQAVGTQAYNEQMTHLNDILPELRQNAYGEWQDARTREIEALSMLLNERDYERSIFESDRAFEESQRQYDENLRETQRQFDKNVEMEETQAKTDRDTLAIQAGFKSWDDYVKAVSSGEYNPNATDETTGISLSDFSDKYLKDAISAWKNGGTEGLQDYLVENQGKYSLNQLDQLGKMIELMYPDGNSRKVVYPQGIEAMHSITDVENYLRNIFGMANDEEIDDDSVNSFLDSLLTYDEMRTDGIDDDFDNKNPEQYGAYLTGQLQEFLRNRKRR